MALIQCPECGQTVSDKAALCPKCGFPIVGATQEKTVPKDEPSEHIPKKSKKLSLIVCVGVAALAVILLSGWLFFRNSTPTITDIEITKWKLIDSGTYSDTYQGTITSTTKTPFVALLGDYTDQDAYPSLVYLEDGEGAIEVRESSDDDPSAIYRPIGYMTGKSISESDFTSIFAKDLDYDDYTSLNETDCTIEITFNLKNSKANGLLFFEVSNDLTKAVRRNCVAVVVNGTAQYSFYLDELPLKSRGVEVTVTPKLFCQSISVEETDYTIESGFTLDKYEGSFYTSYSGEEKLRFDGWQDGIILYTQELTAGGLKNDRGVVNNSRCYLQDSICTLSTYDSDLLEDSETTLLEPEYSFEIIGYLPYKTLD
jgi:hypothetical protein